MYHIADAKISHYRWLEQLVVLLMALGNGTVVDRISSHRHRSIWQNI